MNTEYSPMEFWRSLTDEERSDAIKQRDRVFTRDLIAHEQKWIDKCKEMIAFSKERIRYHVNKDDYTDTDKRLVALYLQYIKALEQDIKWSEKEILLLAKNPVGSRARPGIALRRR